MALVTYTPASYPKLGNVSQFLTSEFGKLRDSIKSLVSAQPRSSTFANLSGSPSVGDRAIVTDSTTVVWGATIAGGGANTVFAWWNGAHWTVMGK